MKRDKKFEEEKTLKENERVYAAVILRADTVSLANHLIWGIQSLAGCVASYARASEHRLLQLHFELLLHSGEALLRE